MGKGKGASRRELNLADMSPQVAEDARWSPDPDEPVDVFPVEMPVDELRRLKGRQDISVLTGSIVEFALSAQVGLSGNWYTIARVDTEHEEVHRHILDKNGKTISRCVIRTIRRPQDVDLGWEEAVIILVDDWDEHERRWRSGR